MADRLEQLLKLHAADPSDAFCPYAIALEHAKAARTTEALAWLDKALATDPRFGYAIYQKARVLAQTGQREQARAVLNDGLRIAREAGDAKCQSEMATLLATL